jgi:methionyl-tRNA formyltransferase
LTPAAGPTGKQRLRTVLLTCGGLYGALVFARLSACDRLDVCAVVRSSRVLDPRFGFIEGAVAQIRRSGVRYAIYLWAITTLADVLCAAGGARGTDRRGGTRAVPASGRAELNVLTTRDVNDAEGRAFVGACEPDLLVSAFFNQRLRPATLALPRIAAVNIHPSLLPEAKGVDPVFQSLLHGTPPVGATVHLMTHELDAGRILAQRPVTPARGASVFETTALAFATGADLLVAALEGLAAGDVGTPQKGAGTYQSWPTPSEVRALRNAGGSLVRFADLVRTARGRLPRTDPRDSR